MEGLEDLFCLTVIATIIFVFWNWNNLCSSGILIVKRWMYSLLTIGTSMYLILLGIEIFK